MGNYAAYAANNRKNRPEAVAKSQASWHQKNKARRAAYKAGREAAKMCATPAWANQFFIEEIYDLARLRTEYLGVKHSVDHIVPMTSKVVCGLHVEHNLRVIPHRQNISKLNRHWPQMP